MRTILTIKQQAEFLSTNWEKSTLVHEWSTRGHGKSKIVDDRGNVIGTAGGCGYDRFGAALGNAIQAMFQDELNTLARRVCKGPRNATRCTYDRLYGMSYNKKTQIASLDGACGSCSMERILNAIGFSLEYVYGSDNRRPTGSVVYKMTPVDARGRRNFQ